MKNIIDFINEALEVENTYLTESEIKSEEDFREYAENKFKKVFKDDLDEEKMKSTIDGILSKHKKEAEAGEWGTLVGVLNKSF